MDIPDSLARRIELWRLHGRIFVESVELFGATSWIAVMLGQNIWPDSYDPVADTLDEAKVAAALAEMRAAYRRAAQRLPPQDEFLRLAGHWHADDAADVDSKRDVYGQNASVSVDLGCRRDLNNNHQEQHQITLT